MSKEHAPTELPAYGMDILNTFYGGPADADKRAEYLKRGIIPTNNFARYVINDPENMPTNAPDSHNYLHKPFGPALEDFRQTHPELWEQARKTSLVSRELMVTFTELLGDGERERAMAMRTDVDEAHWAMEEACDAAFRILAPQLEAQGIDPLDVCR